MQAQDTAPTVEQDNQIDGVVLAVLLDSRYPLTADEVAREVRDDVQAIDSIDRLAAGGLVHRHDGFMFPTRAAVKADGLNR